MPINCERHYTRRQAYQIGRADYLAGDQACDSPFEDGELNDAWDAGFWDAESQIGPCEQVLDRRYGTLSDRSWLSV